MAGRLADYALICSCRFEDSCSPVVFGSVVWACIFPLPTALLLLLLPLAATCCCCCGNDDHPGSLQPGCAWAAVGNFHGLQGRGPFTATCGSPSWRAWFAGSPAGWKAVGSALGVRKIRDVELCGGLQGTQAIGGRLAGWAL